MRVKGSQTAILTSAQVVLENYINIHALLCEVQPRVYGFSFEEIWRYGKEFSTFKRDGGGENPSVGSSVYALWSTGNSGLVAVAIQSARDQISSPW